MAEEIQSHSTTPPSDRFARRVVLASRVSLWGTLFTFIGLPVLGWFSDRGKFDMQSHETAVTWALGISCSLSFILGTVSLFFARRRNIRIRQLLVFICIVLTGMCTGVMLYEAVFGDNLKSYLDRANAQMAEMENNPIHVAKLKLSQLQKECAELEQQAAKPNATPLVKLYRDISKLQSQMASNCYAAERPLVDRRWQSLNTAELHSPENIDEHKKDIIGFMESISAIENFGTNFTSVATNLMYQAKYDSKDLKEIEAFTRTNSGFLLMASTVSDYAPACRRWGNLELSGLDFLKTNWIHWHYDANTKKTIFNDDELLARYSSMLDDIDAALEEMKLYNNKLRMALVNRQSTFTTNTPPQLPARIPNVRH